MPRNTGAFGAQDASSPLQPLQITRRDPGPSDVDIDIAYCGMCHTDLHFLANDLGNGLYPMVPGHEIVGTVRAVGSAVTLHRVGDRVAVGCMVDSCRTCASCRIDLQQYCEQGAKLTYNSPDPAAPLGHTLGGYSGGVVVDQRFVLKLPESLPMAGAAPLVCAGVTAFSPLRRFKAGPGCRVAIVGMGGVGHVAVKIAAAMGAEVTVVTGSRAKVEDALRFGARAGVLNSELPQRADLRGAFDLVLDTASAPRDLHPYLGLLRLDGTLVMLGMSVQPATLTGWDVLLPRRNITGSLIGSLPETQQTLDFCAEHGITCEVELIRPEQAEAARQRLAKGDVRYRFVMDTAALAAAGA